MTTFVLLLDRTPELISIILTFLENYDLHFFSFTSHLCRAISLPVIFSRIKRNVLGTRRAQPRWDLEVLEKADEFFRRLVKTILVRGIASDETISLGPERQFLILTSLHNLRSLSFEHGSGIHFAHLPSLVCVCSELENLQELRLRTEFTTINAGEKDCAGPVALSALSVEWHVSDGPDMPGRSLEYLVLFLRPSLPTLVSLEIGVYAKSSDVDLSAGDLDISALADAASTLRKFTYTTQTDRQALEKICASFSNLTELTIAWKGEEGERPWQESYVKVISSLHALEAVTLPYGSEHRSDGLDNFIAFMRTSTDIRKEYTEKLADACPSLRICTWTLPDPSENCNLVYGCTIHHRVDGQREVEWSTVYWTDVDYDDVSGQ